MDHNSLLKALGTPAPHDPWVQDYRVEYSHMACSPGGGIERTDGHSYVCGYSFTEAVEKFYAMHADRPSIDIIKFERLL